VGVGQSELAVTGMADSTVLVLVPESGDAIQTMKSGVMEAADLYVVNKADRAGAGKLARELEVTLGIRHGNAFRGIRAHHGAALPAEADSAAPGWEPPVLETVATRNQGIGEVAEALERHYHWMAESGELAARRTRRVEARTREVVDRALHRWTWRETRAEEVLRERLPDLAAGRVSPYELAAEIVSGVKEGVRA